MITEYDIPDNIFDKTLVLIAHPSLRTQALIATDINIIYDAIRNMDGIETEWIDPVTWEMWYKSWGGKTIYMPKPYFRKIIECNGRFITYICKK